MNQSKPIHAKSQSAQNMLATIRPHLSANQLQRIEGKIQAWEQAITVAPPSNISSSAEAKPMTPLVMRTKGLPRALDPLYFTLKEPS